MPEPPRASPLVAASTNKIEEQRSCDQSCDSSEAQELSTPLSSPVPSQFDHSTIIVSFIVSVIFTLYNVWQEVRQKNVIL